MRSRGALVACALLSLGVFAGCDDLLEVDLEGDVTTDALDDPNGAPVLVNSTISVIECAYSAFAAGNAAGNEDSYMRTSGFMGGFANFSNSPGNGTCDTADSDYDWWDPFQTGRLVAEDSYERLTGWTVEEVPENEEGLGREEFLAITALYAAIPYTVLGEHMCEVSIEGGDLMSPDETLAVAEQWVTTALDDHISATGDFELYNGITGPDDDVGIEAFAHALRARIRWARGDESGAVADAMAVPQGFVAYASREAGLSDRRNKITVAHFINGYGTVIGPIDWWAGPPNPVTSTDWPAVIPFTGYLDLGIVSADGRAVDADGYPVTTDQAGTEADSRVETFPAVLAAGVMGDKQNKFTDEGDDIPLVRWQEMWLIQAEAAGGQTAIDRVNDIRTAAGLPTVSYANPADAEEIRYMIIEERRRALWLEGRFWSTKIRNTDLLWFPRGSGTTPAGNEYEGAVRMVMNDDEFDLNTNFDRNDRATLCDENQRPFLIEGT